MSKIIIILCSGIFGFSLNCLAEFYSERPDILDVTAVAHSRDRSFELLKEGHLEAVAQILGMYPGQRIFFLARDGELLYDLAKVLSHELDDNEDFNRIRLINVSRLNMSSTYLKEYLEQSGLREEDLRAGHNVLLVDTGFSGTIPAKIQELFPEELRDRIQTQLMCSANPAHPSTRVFLKTLNPLADCMSPSNLHGSIIDYEHRPRYTNRSNEFAYSGNQWLPYSPDDDSTSDGLVSRSEALLDMQALKAYGTSEQTKRRYEARKSFWSSLHDMLFKNRPKDIDALLNTPAMMQDAFRTAIIRDADDIVTKNFPEWRAYMPSLQQMGLSSIDPNYEQSGMMTKAELVAKHPDWKTYVEDPQTGINRLVANGDFHLLRAISDVLLDSEWSRWLSIKLGKRYSIQATQNEMRYTAGARIKVGNEAALKDLLQFTFSSPNVVSWTSELEMLIDTVALYDCASLAKIFAKPHAVNWSTQFDRLLTRCGKETPHALITEVFSKSHAEKWGDKLLTLFEMSPNYKNVMLADFFSQPESGPFQDQFDTFIKTATKQEMYWNLANTFSRPHSKNWNEQLKQLILLGDQKTRRHIAKVAFRHSHSLEFTDELQLLMKVGDSTVHAEIVKSVFQYSQSKIWLDKLVFIIKNASESGLLEIKKAMDYFIQRDPYSLTPRHHFREEIVNSLAIDDAQEREAYLLEALKLKH